MLISYIATLFLSAFLLFLIQPMAGKMLLPIFGGTPSVWNACMVFFQTVLLCGYGYAHLLMNQRDIRRRSRLHLLFMLSGLVCLPLALHAGTVPPADADPTLFLLYRLTLRVGLPFFIVSSSAPVLQGWFSRTGHPAAGDPYFLYAASNFGSLLALLGYPLIVEPLFPVREQSLFWSAGYLLLIVLFGICRFWLVRRASPLPAARDNTPERSSGVAAAPSMQRRLFWLFCAFVPSGLMLGTTTYITTNLAAIPLLWVLPLALYLLSFILVFARKQLLPHALVVRLMPYAAIAFAPFFFLSIRISEFILIPLHLAMFFLTGLFCHGELAARRPAPRYLTAFYFWMSVGGVLGGMFNTLIAPLVFNRIIEYPLTLFLACLLLPQVDAGRHRGTERMKDVLWPLLLGGCIIVLFRIAAFLPAGHHRPVFPLAFVIAGMVCFSFKGRRMRFTLAFGVLLLAMAHVNDLAKGEQVYACRNFFGVKRVVVDTRPGVRYLYHGTTVHGSQSLTPGQTNRPLTYYHRSGPIADVFNGFDFSGGKNRVAVIGLGVGSLASYALPDQHFTFYEIDPDVKRIAGNGSFFGFLSGCRGSYDVVLGDGRLTLARSDPGEFDIIVLDAFSSDAIPVHLLTCEALALYLEKLQPDGLLVFHISNRFLNLEPLMVGLADTFGLRCLIRRDFVDEKDPDQVGKMPSDYAVMGREGGAIRRLAEDSHWQPAAPGVTPLVWTDRFSNLFRLLKH